MQYFLDVAFGFVCGTMFGLVLIEVIKEFRNSRMVTLTKEESVEVKNDDQYSLIAHLPTDTMLTEFTGLPEIVQPLRGKYRYFCTVLVNTNNPDNKRVVKQVGDISRKTLKRLAKKAKDPHTSVYLLLVDNDATYVPDEAFSWEEDNDQAVFHAYEMVHYQTYNRTMHDTEFLAVEWYRWHYKGLMCFTVPKPE